jgi:16S rRNA C1402 (ribose-2'-O) methylase RsmI
MGVGSMSVLVCGQGIDSLDEEVEATGTVSDSGTADICDGGVELPEEIM